MNCREWYECMSPEQWTLLVGSVIALIVAVIATITLLVRWLPGYISRLADEHFKAKEHIRSIEKLETDTEMEARRIEAEIEARQSLAQAEAFEKTIGMFSQVLDRHAKVDERHAENERLQIDAQKQLATAIEALTASSNRSQSFVEKRSDDTLIEISVVSERTANIERTGGETLSRVDLLASGLKDVKSKLDLILAETQKNPNKAALEQIEKAVNELLNLAKAPKPLEVVTLPAIPVPNDNTLPLDEATLNQVTEEKKEDAA